MRGKTVLFGGYDGTNPLGDTWEFDGTTWTQIQTTTSPSARSGHTMVFDPIRKLTYLFGGRDVSSNRNDTWSFDGKDWKFVTTTVVPPGRGYHTMAWDDITGRSMIFGGYAATALADAWAFDGTNWASMPGGPPGRYGSAMTWDDARKRVVLHGGWGAPSADTWDWDGVQWMMRNVVTTPIQLGYATTAYDPLSKQVVRLMGEGPSSQGVVYDDVWAFKTNALASDQVFGTSCKGSASTPLASGGNLAWIGETATFDCSQAPKNSAVVLGLGFSNTVWGALNLPFDLKPFGASGCTLSVALDVTGVAATNGAGEASAAVPIPNDKTLAGAKFYVQFLVPDAAANTFGLTTTNGVEATIGIL
ncbi:MAG: hypothetical protein KDC95_10060 [Planctomycetes bacterium]|nr:hypothetical protein [Planctomycetota bacterium]